MSGDWNCRSSPEVAVAGVSERAVLIGFFWEFGKEGRVGHHARNTGRRRGKKIPRICLSHDEENRGLRGRRAEQQQAPKKTVSIPSGRWRDRFCPNRGDNEWQRAGLLTSRSSYSPRLTAVAGSQSGRCQQWQTCMGLSSLVTAAQPPGISPAQPAPAAPSSLFSCSRGLQALFAHIHNMLWVNQRTTHDVVVWRRGVEQICFRILTDRVYGFCPLNPIECP